LAPQDVQQSNVMAIMCSLQKLSNRREESDPEVRFISNSLRILTTWSGRQVSVEEWTITPFEVEFGHIIGLGGL
jgi:hypothetical protein